jgi:heme-degrading monooxygenase HmoA
MNSAARLPGRWPTPYFAVIFTSVRSDVAEGYKESAELMLQLARQMPGFLGVDSARESIGITVSYWDSLEAISRWKAQADHVIVQRLGRDRWYAAYNTRIARVEREYDFVAPTTL